MAKKKASRAIVLSDTTKKVLKVFENKDFSDDEVRTVLIGAFELFDASESEDEECEKIEKALEPELDEDVADDNAEPDLED